MMMEDNYVSGVAIIFVRILLFLVGVAVGYGLGYLINILCFGFIAQVVDIKNTLHKIAGIEDRTENATNNVKRENAEKIKSVVSNNSEAFTTFECPICREKTISRFCKKCGETF